MEEEEGVSPMEEEEEGREVQRRFQLISNNTLAKECWTRENNRRDEISRLPHEIVYIVLSYLSLKEAVATSVLSSHWVHLWKFTNRLNFDAIKSLMHINENRSSWKEESAKYVEWVNQVLVSHKGLVLEEFRVRFDLDNVYQKDIDYWLKFVVARQVERLELNLLRLGHMTRGSEKCYTFPIELIAQNNGGFKSLRELSLKCVNVTAEVLQYFLLNCPFLERLVVDTTPVLTNFEVCGPSLNLRYLEVRGCYDLDLFKVCNTNLISIRYLGQQRCILLNNPSLIELSLGYTRLVTNFFAEPSRELSQLEFLSVCMSRAKNTMVRQEYPIMPRLKQLEVKFYDRDHHSLLGFSSLVKAAPFLQKFVLNLVSLQRRPRVLNGKSVKKPPTCPHHHLKVVELKGYTGHNNNLQVVMYFLENAVALEELVIDPHLDLFDEGLGPRNDELKEVEEASRKLAKQQIEEISPLHPQIKISMLPLY